MRNRFYPTLSAFHENDPPVGYPPAGFFTKQYLVWVGSPSPGGGFLLTPGGTSGSAPEDIIQAARIQILTALALGGVAGYMIGKRRR